MTEETDIKAAIIKTMESLGLIVIRVQSGRVKGGRMHLAAKGTPDIICAMPGGRILFVEVKTSTGTQSREQVEFESRAKALGAPYLLARCVDDVVSYLKEGLKYDSRDRNVPVASAAPKKRHRNA